MGVKTNITNFINSLRAVPTDQFIIAAMSDPHAYSEINSFTYPSIWTALQQIDYLPWNIGLMLGDQFSADDPAVGDPAGQAIIKQYRLRNKIYDTMGNHDWNATNALWQKYFDPMGTQPLFSGVINAQRPYTVEGSYDCYRLQNTNNINVVLLSDRNEGNGDMGEGNTGATPVEKWRVSGGITLQQWKNLHNYIFSHADKINIIGFHQAIRNTTICSGDTEFSQYGNWSDYSREESNYRGAFAYINNVLATNDIQFFIEATNGLIDFWLSAHVHHRLNHTYLTRNRYIFKNNIHHLNVAQLTKNFQNVNSQNLNGVVWFMIFDGTSVTCRPWIVFDKNSTWPIGFLDSQNINITLSKAFNSNYINPTISAPSNSVIDLVIDDAVSGQLALTFDNQGSTGVLVIRRIGSQTTFIPSNDSAYYRGESAGDGIVAFMGTIEEFIDNGLTPTDDVYYTLFSFNGGGGSIKYKTSSPLQGNQIVT